MIELTADECRVLGVLIEKDKTTPEQYPLTLNSTLNGASQKNNRDPVFQYDEDQIRVAINGLRQKGLLVQMDGPGSRVPKYRHTAEKLGINVREMVILAELLLRGPQTLGELRGRASRMYPLDSLEMVKSALDQLITRPEPLVRQLPPSPGSRAERYTQILCPDLHPLDASSPAEDAPSPDQLPPGAPTLSQRVAQLETEVAALRAALQKLATALGEPDPLATEQKPE